MKVLIPQMSAMTITTAMIPKMIIFFFEVFVGVSVAGGRAAGAGDAGCDGVVAGSVVVPMLLFLCVVKADEAVTALIWSYGSAVTEPTARASATFAPW